jgi:2-C-methyl-D-erythritol 2,4-cyclodiphosphate synthase
MEGKMNFMRIGMGSDIHRMVSGRKLVLGGETIPFQKGLLGHSDADVLVHAICDALLGAACMGDIGNHFPDSDTAYKDCYSIDLLKQTGNLIRKEGFFIINLDSTIFAEAPKISPYYEKMKQNIANALQIEPTQVNIKSTTTEQLGFIGRGEGIGATCISLISRKM